MNRYILVLLGVMYIGPAFGGGVYKCMDENGSVTFSGVPCAKPGDRQEALEVSSKPSRSAEEEPIDDAKSVKQLIVGRWRWSDGSEVRTFHPSGRFESRGEDSFAATEGKGEWELNGNDLVIRASFVNALNSGEKVSVYNTLKYTVESVDESRLVTYWPKYDKTSEWIRM
ncbi:DUF4124 domain-containing protein [Arhodomonas sp. AD133]|uniref:DUF4124 domain-containing protein n=1 Tax=Arhodomonas sp. AD133 TaxID=3415009 RepID=UPI003EBBA33E